MRERLVVKSTLAEPICVGFLGALPAIPMVLLAPLKWKLIGAGFFIAILWIAIRLAKRQLILHEQAITQVAAFGTRELAWDDVDHYTFWSSNPNVAYVGGAQAGAVGVIAVLIIAGIVAAVRKKGPANRKFAQGRLTLVGKTGRRIAIANTYRG